MKSCVKTCEAELGEFNKTTAVCYSNLGLLYQDMERNSEAEELLNKALNIQLTLLGPTHESVAKSHNFLAVLYKNNMKLSNKAETHNVEAIRIWTELFGPGYVELQYDYDGLIDLYSKTGQEKKRKETKLKKKEWKRLQNTKAKESKNIENAPDIDDVEEIVKFILDS